eukprot:CAMPEP_0204188774 /NCGR_PEP_ID=MMETSP0361-20130328/57927_1 /ASSEMBLY_ACC=CAM_ASM_000343 /TAXON_ID=268821 /ORGANISM="Scrippsiella Hangoei, Strain SHTV-5" /LENGTH=33 /DNA_ID= /DNA_START= /DNA_END= /DNA_ORIENTATION=
MRRPRNSARTSAKCRLKRMPFDSSKSSCMPGAR